MDYHQDVARQLCILDVESEYDIKMRKQTAKLPATYKTY